jgi:hypothetical protein
MRRCRDCEAAEFVELCDGDEDAIAERRDDQIRRNTLHNKQRKGDPHNENTHS